MRCPICGNDERWNWHLCIAGSVVEHHIERPPMPPMPWSEPVRTVPRASRDPESRGYVPEWAEKL